MSKKPYLDDIIGDEFPEDQRGDAWEGPSASSSSKPKVSPEQAADEEPSTLPFPDSFPEPPGKEAYFGLAGELVKTIEPESEADPMALLVTINAMFGNAVGRTAYFEVEGTRHYTNSYSTLVGDSSKARKGTSLGRIRPVFEEIDHTWASNRISGGLSSGEGLIAAIRDELVEMEDIIEGGKVVSQREVVVAKGVDDKRLLLIESEFASVLRRMDGQTNNSLSAILRQLWDHGTVSTMVKNNAVKTTGGHVSIVAHITCQELKRYLSSTESANGLGNRFQWYAVRRSKCLPRGGKGLDMKPFIIRFAEAVAFARSVGKMDFDHDGGQLWDSVYPKLSEGKPGMIGNLTNRSEAQVLRLACIYALLDRSCWIEAQHLMAALALWDYSERSVAYIFANATGDDVADTIMSALRQRPQGMTRTEINNVFGGHRKTSRINEALTLLEQTALAHCRQQSPNGRACIVWFAGPMKRSA